MRGQRSGRLDGADGALAGRCGHLQRPARAPVGRHHGARSGPGGAARGGQPAALRAGGELGQQHDERDAGDPGRAGVGRVGWLVGDALGGRGGAVGPGAAAGWVRAGALVEVLLRLGVLRRSALLHGLLRARARHRRPGSWGGRPARLATYTPDPGFSGVDSFQYVATDARRSRVAAGNGAGQGGVLARRRFAGPPRPACRRCASSVVGAVACGPPGLRAGASLRPPERRRGQRKVVFRLKSRRVRGRRARMAIGRLGYGRYRAAAARGRAGRQREVQGPETPPLLDWRPHGFPATCERGRGSDRRGRARSSSRR